MITPEYIEKIHKIENAIQQFPGFAYYCILDQRVYGLRHCAPPNSAISYFYPSVGEQQLIYDGHGTSIVDFTGTVAALKKFATVGVTTSTHEASKLTNTMSRVMPGALVLFGEVQIIGYLISTEE